jgi:hypothetical protein
MSLFALSIHRPFRNLVVLAAILVWDSVSAAETAPTSVAVPSAVEKAAELPKVPWHMVNLWWSTSGPIEEFSEFSVDVDISTDMPAETYNLYIAPFGGMTINDESVYGGIQTNCNGWNAMAPGDQKRLHGGHGFIFSRWSEKSDLNLDDVRATPGGFVETAGYEGHFASVRRPYPWKAGKYTYSLRRLDTQMVNGRPYTWVGAFVREHASEREIFVGALRFAGDKLKNNGRNSAFLEFYGTEKTSHAPDIASLPPLVVKYSNLRFNGEPADLTKVTARFIRKDEKRADGLSAPISPNLLHVRASEDGREITCSLQNKVFPDAEEPDRVLWQKPGIGQK